MRCGAGPGSPAEIDGARWHLDAAAWERDLRRANALQATGLRLLRFSVRQLMYEPEVVIAAVRAALAASHNDDREADIRRFA